MNTFFVAAGGWAALPRGGQSSVNGTEIFENLRKCPLKNGKKPLIFKTLTERISRLKKINDKKTKTDFLNTEFRNFFFNLKFAFNL